MATPSSSVRSVLRRLSVSSFRSRSSPALRHSLARRSDNSTVSSLLNETSLAAFSQVLHGKGNIEDARLLSIRHALSQPADRGDPPESRTASWNKSPEFKLPDRTLCQWRHAASPVILHPMRMISCRGLASCAPNDDASASVVITDIPGDDSANGTQSATDWIGNAYNKVVDSIREAVHVVSPPFRTLLDTYPVIQDVSVPVFVLTGAWIVMPRVLRRMHRYVEQGSGAFQLGPETTQTVPYEHSVWKAMEDPARLFATLLTGLQVGVILVPNAGVAQYVNQFWSGGSVLCVVWFLHRWKSNLVKGLLSRKTLTKEDRERYLGLDKFASLTLISIGALGVAEAAGVALSSLLAVGGIGGIATAFAAREILSNLLTGLTLSFSKSFAPGDSIKAGTVEGKVEVVGLTTTRLLSSEKNQIIVPNAYFTSQAIINKSRAPWRVLSVNIPIQLQDFEKVPTITLEIREMLYRYNEVYLDEDKPSCYISEFTPAALEIAISCNIKPMDKNDYRLVEQGILVEAARIITATGATLGGKV